MTFVISLVRIPARTVIGKETFWLLPTARNSNLFPVKAKGHVLLRSVLSCMKALSPGISSPRSLRVSVKGWPLSMQFSSLSTYDPKKTDIIDGGASCPPSLL